MSDGDRFYAFIGAGVALMAAGVLTAAYNVGHANGATKIAEDCRRDGFFWHFDKKYECRQVAVAK